MHKSKRVAGPSRREFLADMAVASAALAGGLSLPAAGAAAARKVLDQLNKLDLGLRPASFVPGAVQVDTELASYILFSAVREDENGNDYAAGTAVIELVRPCTEAVSYEADDDPDGGRPPYFEQLDNGDICAVENSTWLADVARKGRHPIPRKTITVVVPKPPEPQSPESQPPAIDSTVAASTVAAKSKRKAKHAPPQKIQVTIPARYFPKPGKDARHYVFSFRGTTFHCVADDLKVELRTDPLGDILADLEGGRRD